MKKLLWLALLQTLWIFPEPSPVFTPFSLTNNGAELLAFPGAQGPQVLYWLKAGPTFLEKSGIGFQIYTNQTIAEPLRLQIVTNTIQIKQPQIAGKVIGGLVGALLLGIGSGVAISDLHNANSATYLGIFAAAGAASFGIGFVFDLGDTLGKIRFLSTVAR